MRISDKKTAFMSIRITDHLREQIRKQAKESQRTIAGQVLYYVKQGLDNEKTSSPSS